MGLVMAAMCAQAMGEPERKDADGNVRPGDPVAAVALENPPEGDELNRWLTSRICESRSEGDVERNAAVPPALGDTVGAARYGTLDM